MEVKRYHLAQDLTEKSDYMKSFDDGDYVLHSDHLATIAELTRERDELREELSQFVVIGVANMGHEKGKTVVDFAESFVGYHGRIYGKKAPL